MAPSVPLAALVAEGQAAGQVQGVGGAAPPAQKTPLPQGAPPGEVEPAAQPHPGAALQGPLQVALVRPVAPP